MAKEFDIEKACNWLKEHAWDYVEPCYYDDSQLVEDFRKAMESA